MENEQLKPAVILVADRTLSAGYKILFEGIFATMQTTRVPRIIMRRLLSPPAGLDGSGRAQTAVLGLRRVEASLLHRTSLEPSDVVCTTPEGLPGLLGPWVGAVLFSSSDPLGMGMSNTTTTNFWDGELYTALWTRELLVRLSQAKKKYGFKVVAGGPGAWQFSAAPRQRSELGIDAVFSGYFESAGPEFINALLESGECADCTESAPCAGSIVPIRGASTMGVIELSRGCGRGCSFCTMAQTAMEHVDPDTIIADLERNSGAGIRSAVSSSEDFFRYGGRGAGVDFNALARLLERMRGVEGLSFMQIDHANVSSVLQFSDSELRLIRELLRWGRRCDYLWVNMGVESASGPLLRANCPGKMAPFEPDDWGLHVREAADKMIRCGFFPVFSIILGLPGETPDDVRQTRRLVEHLSREKCAVFPIFYEPPCADGARRARRFTMERMTRERLELYRACYEINFRAVPRMYWDNQRAGGVSFLRRSLMRLLGKAETRMWRKAFRKAARRIGAGVEPDTASGSEAMDR